MTEDEEDPRAKRPGICGVTTVGGTGIEWICVRPVHAKVYYRHSNGAPIFPSGYGPTGRPVQADRHLFVPRYPMRPPPNSWRDDQQRGCIGAEGSALPGDSR